MDIRKALTATVAAATLALAACASNDTEADTNNGTTPETTTTTAQDSDHGPIVDRITTALDKLNAPWDNITYKGENEEAVSTDVWELDINNRGSYIHVFLDEDARKDWEQSAIWLDGITVAYDNVGISLNSGLGKHDSLALAPKLADELGGRVTTGDTDMFRDEDEWGAHPDDGTDPTTVSAPEPESIWAPTGQGYQCPRTDAFVWDSANCTPENLGAGHDDPYSEEVAAHNAEVEAYEERVEEYDAAWVECLGDVNRPDYYEREDYCEATIPEP